jgi:hypothetical protein
MTETERLFLRTLEDIENRIESNDSYKVLGLSGLIRKLFFDDNPLVDQVNRTYRSKIKFVIAAPDPTFFEKMLSMETIFYFEDVNPEIPFPNQPIIEISRDQFFSTRVLIVETKAYSIREIILFEANVMGGIHAGMPKTEKEKTLASINSFFVGGDIRIATRQLLAISRIIIKALNPLREAILSAS